MSLMMGLECLETEAEEVAYPTWSLFIYLFSRLAVQSILSNYDASKNGVAQEAVRRGYRKMMSEAEARQILGVTEHSSWEEILKRYDNLLERNAKNGSFYLLSQVHRAKELLETIHQTKA